MSEDLGNSVQPQPQQVALYTGRWAIPANGLQMQFYGVPMSQARTHLQLLQGRLPADQGSQLEIALTSSAAFYLNVKAGSVISLLAQFHIFSDSTSLIQSTIQAHVVGIFQVAENDSYWNGFDFVGYAPIAPPGQLPAPYSVLTSSALLLHTFDTITQNAPQNYISFSNGDSNTLYLTYSLLPATITSYKLDDIIGRLGTLQQDVVQNFDSGYSAL